MRCRPLPLLARILLPLLPLLAATAVAAQVPAASGVSGASATPDTVPATASRLKIGASTLLGIPSVGLERRLRDPRRAFQWDLMLSPWRSVDGYPLEFLVAVAEWRWYREASQEGWYGAVHLGAAAFRLQRPYYRDTTLYQEGGSLLGGVSVGRVWRMRNGWTVDAYVGGGTVQSLYKGYDRLTGSRYDGARLWNVSGEWLPYRSGLSVGIPWRGRTRR